ncbi:acyltransferase [Kineosporia sp. NBRC 101677]|uniref:acyltransferase family protein n=1 Tax=Kineosporia sp. NBRC 101677 TaxID=3032197 RepID=UPI0024A23D16|nr:acyltransferase family protein [Kineosporia sp. NBRC 101677]GLY13570.1 acyltransferase [Kineosporia sp. NBRC 101677]
MSDVEIRPVPAQEAQSAPRTGFRPDIEGLRALAVLLVVLYHCGVGVFSGGYVGVDVFFVISGFLITSHLAREATATGRLRIGRFYARRALRLLPAATLVLVSTLIAAWVWLPPLRLRAIAYDAATAAGYVINIRLIQSGNDYRAAGDSPSPLQHFWSLAVEEQFYLFIPLLVLIGLVLLRRRAVFIALLTALVAASFVESVTGSQTSSIAAYFGAPSRAWELGAGSLLAVAMLWGKEHQLWTSLPLVQRLAPVLGWLGLVAVVYAAVAFDASTPFPSWYAAVPVLGTTAVIAAGLRPGSACGRMLGLRLPQFIGARSYSWYLWHWPALILAPHILGREIANYEKLLTTLVALGLACISYSLVEQPLRHHQYLRSHLGAAGALAVGLTAVTVTVALLIPTLPDRRPQGETLATSLTLEGPPSQRFQALSRRLQAATHTSALPRNLVPPLTEAATDEPSISSNGCFVAVAEDHTPEHCLSLGRAKGRTTVVLFGDSHAAQWFPAMEAMARKHHWRLAVFTKVMCTPAEVSLYAEAFRGGYRTCDDWRQNSIARINALRPDLVVMTSIADHMDLTEGNDDVDGTWARGWASTAGRLRAKKTDLVFLADTPAAKTNVPECLSLNPRDVQNCAQSADRATESPQRTRIAQEVQAAGARVVDPMPWFCSDSSCPVVVGNTLIYRDDNHITGKYARLLAPLLAEELMPKP